MAYSDKVWAVFATHLLSFALSVVLLMIAVLWMPEGLNLPWTYAHALGMSYLVVIASLQAVSYIRD